MRLVAVVVRLVGVVIREVVRAGTISRPAAAIIGLLVGRDVREAMRLVLRVEVGVGEVHRVVHHGKSVSEDPHRTRFIFKKVKKVFGAKAGRVPTRKKTFSLDKASGICYCANLRKSLIFKHLRGAPPTPTQVVDIQGVTW